MDTSDSKSEVLQSGLLKEQLPNLKKRLKAYYYKRVTVTGGDMKWMRTELLPADPSMKMYYLSKGFRLDPPQGTEWARNAPQVVDEHADTTELYAEIAALKAKLKTQEEVQEQLDAVKKQMGELTVHKGRKRQAKKEV